MAGSGVDVESLRKNADTTKMPPEDIKKYGLESAKRPPGHNPGGVLHQRRSLPFRPLTAALGGFLIVATIGYFTLYARSKPGTTPKEVAKVIVNPSDAGDGGVRDPKNRRL